MTEAATLTTAKTICQSTKLNTNRGEGNNHRRMTNRDNQPQPQGTMTATTTMQLQEMTIPMREMMTQP
jgi:hypothetical protein